VELVLELPAPDGLPARAVALGVARLHHEALDHAVEQQPVGIHVSVRERVREGGISKQCAIGARGPWDASYRIVVSRLYCARCMPW
jgi:hypothetical protein